MASITCYNQSAVRFRYPKPHSLSPCFRWVAFNMRTQGVSTRFVVSLSRKLHRNTRIPILAKKIRVPLLLPFFLRFNLPSPRRPSFPRAERNFKPCARRSALETCLFCCVSSVCRVLVDPFPWTWLVPIICHATLASTFVNLTATEFILAENAVNFAAVCTSRAPLPRQTPRYQTKR